MSTVLQTLAALSLIASFGWAFVLFANDQHNYYKDNVYLGPILLFLLALILFFGGSK